MGQIVTLIFYPFGIHISKFCVIIIITCLGLADASWPQPGDDFAVSMGTVEEMVLFVWLVVLALKSTPAV